jgi:4-amino-4-deoxy-L-arabinose transferase-like glycosyltransferase
MQETALRQRLCLSDTGTLWITGLAFTLMHIATSGRYGFHRDELLSYTNALHLDWCYVVYSPITAWLARGELAIFGTSLTGYRFLAAVSIGLVAVLSGLIARQLGGKRQAILVAAVAASIGGPVVFSGSFLSYMTFDMFCWVAVAWCIACLLRSQDPRWWLATGAAVGIGIMCKYTMLFLVAGLLGGMLLTPNRRFLRSIWFWAGIALALAIISPVVFWQFQHHFVGLDWMKSIHARDIRWGRTDYFLLNQFWKATNPITVPLWCAGLWFLFATQQGKPFRLLGWMYVIPLVAFLAARGRDYYLSPGYPMLLAAGAVWGERWLASLQPRVAGAVVRATWNSLVISGLIVVSLVAPVAPVNSAWWRVADAANDSFNMEIGWPEIAATVAQVRDTFPTGDRTHLGILAGDEGEAGAINLYGHAYGLPAAISGMNSNWLRGYGDPPPQTVIMVGMDHDFLERNFVNCTWAAHLSNPYGVINEAIGKYSEVYVCGAPRQGWPEFWKHFQSFG